MRSFHGAGKKKSYFEGWYFKQQNKTDTVAFIPAFHVDGEGRRSASLQVITNTEVYNVDYPAQEFWASRKKLQLRLGHSSFSSQGCRLDVKSEDLSIEGALHYDGLTPPSYDIMGPFRFVPLLECRHSIFSLSHRVNGSLTVNGRKIVFRNGSGYLEGDRGASFPNRYIWTQSSFLGNCVMLSIADVPLKGHHFIGCIGAVYYEGKEYRIATYLGVKLLYVAGDTVFLRQGELSLQVELITSGSHILRAPKEGGMVRGIHESASCRVRYTCTLHEKVLFDFTSEQASYENNWAPAAPGHIAAV